MVGGMDARPLVRLGLSRAALKAAILAELEDGGVDSHAEVIATAVAEAMDANNQELMRQFRELLTSESASALQPHAVVGPEADTDDL